MAPQTQQCYVSVPTRGIFAHTLLYFMCSERTCAQIRRSCLREQRLPFFWVERISGGAYSLPAQADRYCTKTFDSSFVRHFLGVY